MVSPLSILVPYIRDQGDLEGILETAPTCHIPMETRCSHRHRTKRLTAALDSDVEENHNDNNNDIILQPVNLKEVLRALE